MAVWGARRFYGGLMAFVLMWLLFGLPMLAFHGLGGFDLSPTVRVLALFGLLTVDSAVMLVLVWLGFRPGSLLYRVLHRLWN